MAPVLTIAIPVYKRLDYLPDALRCAEAQDYPAIELLVSDNGQNGGLLQEILQTCTRPYRLRSNPQTVDSAVHFNQMIAEARGEYFTLLADDDWISPTFASTLVGLLEAEPGADLAMSAQEAIDDAGRVLSRSTDPLPPVLQGEELVEKVWSSGSLGFQCVLTFVARTSAVRRAGGFPLFTGATHDDDALFLKLCLGRKVVLSSDCTFRFRIHAGGMGWRIPFSELVAASDEFASFLDSDPGIASYARSNPTHWPRLRDVVTRMSNATLYRRWRTNYRRAMPILSWLMWGGWLAARCRGTSPLAFSRDILSMTKSVVRARAWPRPAGNRPAP